MLNETDLSGADLSRADLNLLVLFEIVREEGHVGRAAERLNLSSSAVSHGLGRLRRLLNDPLFLKTPKGVVPTARALELAAPIADILARVQSVVATAAPFEPATSTRRFTIGAPDGVSAVFLAPLLARLGKEAPGIDIGVRQLLPTQGETSPDRAWRGALADLEARAMDIAIVPTDQFPPRFHGRVLFEEDFVLAMRAGHPFARAPTLDRYCAMRHLVVSLTGDPFGFVDRVLGRTRPRAADRAHRAQLHVCARGRGRDRPDHRAAPAVRRPACAPLRRRAPRSPAAAGTFPPHRRRAPGCDDGRRPRLAVRQALMIPF